MPKMQCGEAGSELTLSTSCIVQIAVLIMFPGANAAARVPLRVHAQQSAPGAPQPSSVASPATLENPPGIQALAGRMAEAIAKSKQRKVLVFDFAGPYADLGEVTPKISKKAPTPPLSEAVTVFGRTLASEISTAMGRSLPKVEIRCWDQFYQTLPPSSLMPPVVEDPVTAWWAADAAKFDLFIWGDFQRQPDNKWKLRVLCYRVQGGRSIVGLEVAVLPGTNPKELTFATAKGVLDASYPAAGKNGVTLPRCQSCPQPEFPGAAIGQNAEGSVELDIVVGTDGRAKRIKVLRALPYGFTDNAVEAVQRWRLDPALGPDGKPTAVRQIIVVTFRLR